MTETRRAKMNRLAVEADFAVAREIDERWTHEPKRARDAVQLSLFRLPLLPWSPTIPEGWKACSRCEILTRWTTCGRCEGELLLAAATDAPGDQVREARDGEGKTHVPDGTNLRDWLTITTGLWKPSAFTRGNLLDRQGGDIAPNAGAPGRQFLHWKSPAF